LFHGRENTKIGVGISIYYQGGILSDWLTDTQFFKESAMSAIQTLDIRGRKFVVIPESECRRLTKRPASAVPPMPTISPDGTYPAADAMRAMMAQKISAARNAVGLSQDALARRAGIRVETLNRLEMGKHTPELATMAKIDKALDNAGGAATMVDAHYRALRFGGRGRSACPIYISSALKVRDYHGGVHEMSRARLTRKRRNLIVSFGFVLDIKSREQSRRFERAILDLRKVVYDWRKG